MASGGRRPAVARDEAPREAEETGRQDARGRRRLATLRLLAATWIPALEPPAGAEAAEAALWRRSGPDLSVERAVAAYIGTRLPARDREDLGKLLDLLRVLHLVPAGARERFLSGLRRLHPDVAVGLDGLRALTLLHFYAEPGPDGRNPNWEALGYPGPPDIVPPSEAPDDAPLPTLVPPSGSDHLELHTEVCVLGSGAGGGVIAAVLAQAGVDVVVLEAGAHRDERNFPVHELAAFRDLYWRGGHQPTADRMVALLAGATLGGGTTVNWMNCVLPPEGVRQEWAEHGLKGLDGEDFDRHLEAVLVRISATAECSDRNGPNARLAEGAEALAWSWKVARRNADASRYDAGTAGHMGFGDRSGSKQSTVRTFLRDAVGAGARVVPSARAWRVLVEGDRASGVEGTVAGPDGGAIPLTVRARTVVVAGGALETPAILLRSGIGGPAAGRFLRLHPVDALAAIYPEPQRAWWGAPQTVVVDEHRDLAGGYGFLVECPHFGTGLAAASLPFRSAREHKAVTARSARIGSFIGLVRDRGAGRVTLDEAGEAHVAYPLDDPLDQAHLREALGAMARLHAAAGAEEILDLHPSLPRWRRGEDLDAFVGRISALPMGAGKGGRNLFSAHQMGTARMGSDPATSVADPEGRLHDTVGVWVGDTSAFPTAVGSNPMVTCMALARRTAHAILAERQ